MKKQTDIAPDTVKTILAEAGFTPENSELEVLAGYLSMVQKWNKVMNLVGPYSWREILGSLMIDSLHLARFLATLPFHESPQCWDFGAGAGLPGIPLRAVWGKGTYHLVEAREKRALFMKQVLARYPMQDTHVHQQRVEDFMEGREPADMLVSRAFMPWQKLLTLMDGKIAQHGRIVFLALEDAPELLPSGWRTEASASYAVDGGKRYFWSVTPINAPS